MKKSKKEPLPVMILVGIAAILLLLIFSCGLMALVYFFSAPSGNGAPANGSPDGAGHGTGNGSDGGGINLNISTVNISAEDMSLWTSINIENVQQACLLRAKEEAGSSADMVYSCTCNESAATIVKQYGCTIRTADPFTKYFANIRCSLPDRICSVETNYGTSNVTFAELRTYYSGE